MEGAVGLWEDAGKGRVSCGSNSKNRISHHEFKSPHKYRGITNKQTKNLQEDISATQCHQALPLDLIFAVEKSNDHTQIGCKKIKDVQG